jgi:predicted KAP-like P-loop ATPase
MIPTAEVSLSADSPITSRIDDVLGYAPFARSLAIGLISAPRDGFVVGVQAQWGMGKTSAVNLLIEALNEREGELQPHQKTIISFFNPWLFSGVDALARGYMGELGSLIASAVGERGFDKSKKLLRSIGRGGSELIGGAAALAVIAATGGAAIPLAATIKGGASGAISLASHMSDGRSLDALASDLRTKLHNMDRRILIILDDLDRLTPEELRQVLTLVKTFGNLPNVVHVLVYDRGILEQNLSLNEDSEKFPSYLQKIIQAEFDLPLPTRSGIAKLVDKQLSGTLGEIEQDDNWNEVWGVGLENYLRSPRDVIRLGNAVSVTWPAVRDEVYAPDFIAIELFRIFERDVYNLLARNREMLVGTGGIYREESLKRLASDISDSIPTIRREAVTGLVRRMFPRLEKHLTGWSLGSPPQGHRQGRLIGSADGFDSFFRFEPSPLAIPLAEVRELHKRIEDAAYVADALASAANTVKDGRSLAGAFFDELLDLVRERETFGIGTLAGLAQSGGLALKHLDDSGESLFSYDNRHRISLLISMLLGKYASENAAADFGNLAAGDVYDLSVTGLVLAKVGVPFKFIYPDSDDGDSALLTEEQLNKIAARLATRIGAAAKTGSLINEPELWLLLRIWDRFAGKNRVRKWIARQIGDADAAKAIAFSAMNITSKSSEGVRRKINRLPDENIYDMDALSTAISSHIDHGSYQGSDLIDLTTFLESVAKLKAGESADW